MARKYLGNLTEPNLLGEVCVGSSLRTMGPIPSETDSWSRVLLSFDVVPADMHHMKKFVHH